MRFDKKALVSHIQKTVDGKDYFFLISYMGMTVGQQEELKVKLYEQKATLQVFKNSLIKEASKNQEYSAIANLDLNQGTALVTGEGEAPSVAKLIKDFGKDNEVVQIKVAYFDRQVLEQEEAVAVAKLPTKDVAHTQLLGVLNATSRNFVNVLNTRVTTIVNVLKAIKEKKESE